VSSSSPTLILPKHFLSFHLLFDLCTLQTVARIQQQQQQQQQQRDNKLDL
jgi:hypothetical protein